MNALRRFTFSLLVASAGLCATVTAQEPMEVAPLFQYPEAPADLSLLSDRTDWLMTHFWEPFDFKAKKPVDQNALNHAFRTYASMIPYSSAEVVNKSIDDLLKTLKKNPTLLLQFTKAAEESLYGPRADMFIDEIYMKFLREASTAKKIPEGRRLRYSRQLKTLEATQTGKASIPFDFHKPDGSAARYFPMSTPTLFIFGHTDCDDCRMAALKLDSNAALSRLVAQGKANVIFMVPDADGQWTDSSLSLPKQWIAGAADADLHDIYDIRLSPTLYIVDGQGNFKAKNITVTQAIDILSELSESKLMP